MVKPLPSNAGGMGSIRGLGAKIPHASQPKNQNIKQKQYCNKFNKDFKKRSPGNVRYSMMTVVNNIVKVKVLVAQSCQPLFIPMDCSLPGSCSWNSPGKNT